MIDLHEYLARQRAAIDRFVAAVMAGDGDRIAAAMDEFDHVPGWTEAMRKTSRLSSVPAATREFFLGLWVRSGDGLRDTVNDDLVLIDALRVLLPPYTGGPQRLYRGETAFARRRRRYGPSWTSDRETAEGFATGTQQEHSGGSVLLMVDAPPEAIVFAPAMLGDDYEEEEYFVDRRRIRNVQVLARFPEREIRPGEADGPVSWLPNV